MILLTAKLLRPRGRDNFIKSHQYVGSVVEFFDIDEYYGQVDPYLHLSKHVSYRENIIETSSDIDYLLQKQKRSSLYIDSMYVVRKN